MPYKAPTICRWPGCSAHAAAGKGYCEKHWHEVEKKRKETYSYDYSQKAQYYNSKWHVFSRRFLRHHPVCVVCGEPATITDHIIPADVMYEMYGRVVLRDEFYQPLCIACNAKKASTTDKKRREEWEKLKKNQTK
jgi:5-methylcytosine-specific restriction endonuclease McrA